MTGGLGYVGGRVAQYLSEFPDFSLRLGTRQKKPPQPSWLKRGEIIPLDLLSEESLDNACRGVDAVLHLAAINEIESLANPKEAFKINSLGTLKTLLASKKARVKKFIYLSTAHIYGAPLLGTITEKTLPHPVHPYAITHRAAEDWVLAAHQKGSLTGLVIRLSNSFGPPIHPSVNRWTLVINDLCCQAATSKKLTLRSSGLQKRDFIPLEDVCRSMHHLLTLPEPLVGDGLFNLGGECSLSIAEIAEKIADRSEKVLGFRPVIEKPGPSANEIFETLDYRIDKLKKTGFQLQGDMNSEIDATLLFCREHFSSSQ